MPGWGNPGLELVGPLQPGLTTPWEQVLPTLQVKRQAQGGLSQDDEVTVASDKAGLRAWPFPLLPTSHKTGEDPDTPTEFFEGGKSPTCT
jgi:hypothetical protein